MRLVTRRLAPIGILALLVACATAVPAWAEDDGKAGRNGVSTGVSGGGLVTVGAKTATSTGGGGGGNSSGGSSSGGSTSSGRSSSSGSSSGRGSATGGGGGGGGPSLADIADMVRRTNDNIIFGALIEQGMANGGTPDRAAACAAAPTACQPPMLATALAPGGGGGGPAGAPAPPPPPDPQVVAQEVVARMQIPAGAPKIGPPPEINPWKKAIVGYPLWLWTEDPGQMDQTVTAQGLTMQLSARRSATVFTTGDGATVRCGTTSRWSPSVTELAKSPTCGHAYTKVGNFTLTATSTWEVTWSALGQTGTIPVTRSATAAVPVTELQAVNVGPR